VKILNRNIDIQNGSFSFSDYFKMNIDIDELVEEFGYKIDKKYLEFEQTEQNEFDLERLQKQIETTLKFISLDSEIAIREFLIAPILILLVEKFEFKLKPEKSIYFNEKLKGVLDYYIDNRKNGKNLVVIEAKNSDLNNGLKQLAMELIAIDSLLENKEEAIFGSVTIGTDWIFSKIDRENKIIEVDLKTYRLPEELEKVISIFSSILKN
jgi:hypothetical protein